MESSWTFESLREYVIGQIKLNDERYGQRFADLKVAVDLSFSAQKELVQSALLSADRAVLKAETANEKRFDAVNEFRGTLADQQRMLMPRAEVEIIVKNLTERIQSLSDFQKIHSGEDSGKHTIFAWGMALMSFVVSLISMFVAFKK